MQVKTRKPMLLLALLAVIGTVVADEDAGLGPWRLGMSKEQIVAFAEQGPYADAANGGVETSATKFKGRKTSTSLAFTDAKLSSVVVRLYAGDSWGPARDAVLDVFDQFAKSYGGANVKEISDKVQRAELETILDRTLGTAESMNGQYAKKGKSMTARYDMVPLKQPAESRLHCQWSYIGKTNTYAVYLYQDLPGAPTRDAADNIEIE